MSDIAFSEVKYDTNFYLFKPIQTFENNHYEKGFGINDIFHFNSVGFVSANDGLNVSYSLNEQKKKINDLLLMEESIWRLKYKREKDARDWTYKSAQKDANENNLDDKYQVITYRPFDSRWTLYTGNSRCIQVLKKK